MSLVEKTKKKAEEMAKAKRQKEEAEQRAQQVLKDKLDQILTVVLDGLQEFDGVKCHFGTFRLIRLPASFSQRKATFRLIRPSGRETDLFHITAAIRTSRYRMCDECPEEEFTEPWVGCEGELQAAHGLNPLRNDEIHTLENCDRLLDHISDWLAVQLFTEE